LVIDFDQLPKPNRNNFKINYQNPIGTISKSITKTQSEQFKLSHCLLKCLYQARKVNGHVFMRWGSEFASFSGFGI
jgi:hypothetical protein